MLLLLGLRRRYISGSKKRVKRLFLKGVKVCLIALFTEMLPRRFVARVDEFIAVSVKGIQ